jgi:hypothetical protein
MIDDIPKGEELMLRRGRKIIDITRVGVPSNSLYTYLQYKYI